MEKETGIGFPLTTVAFMTGVFIMLALRFTIDEPTTEEAQFAVKEFIQHPEEFKIEYVTHNGDTTDVIVTYLK